MDRCTKCGELVDTDDFPEFYDFAYKVNDMGGYCEDCRNAIYDAMTEAEQAEQAEHEKRTYG